MADALARLADGGASILLAEQKTDLLAEICHRVVVLDAGRVALEGPAATVLADPRLEQLGVAAPGVRTAGARRRGGRLAASSAGPAASGSGGMTGRAAPS